MTGSEAGPPRSGIARLWKPVVNVQDMDEGERFWSAVSGLTPMGRQGEQFAVLDDPAPEAGAGWLLLQLVPKGSTGPGGVHLDFRVDDVAGAAAQIEEIGGTVIKAPGLYEVDGTPVLEWAVMGDPFGNEFCIIRYPLSNP